MSVRTEQSKARVLATRYLMFSKLSGMAAGGGAKAAFKAGAYGAGKGFKKGGAAGGVVSAKKLGGGHGIYG